MKVAITGCGGFVGSHLAATELVAGNVVYGIDVSEPDKVRDLFENSNFTYFCDDMRNRSFMAEIVQECDLVYHLGAIASVYVYCTDPKRVLDVNIGGTKLLAELCYEYKKKIFFASSSEVYGKNPFVPWKETGDSVFASGDRIRWCYATTKLAGEFYIAAYQRQGLRASIARFFNFYGPRLDFLDNKGRVITCFLNSFLKGADIEVIEPGSQTRCFTYIDDGIEGVRRVAHMSEAEGEVFNIGSSQETSVLELAKVMKRIGKFDSRITMIQAEKIYGPGYEDIFRRVPDVSKAKKLLNWSAKISLEEGLEKTIAYFKNR